MRQVADWLERIGMPEYIQRFAENNIDFAILGELSDQDLEKIGVTSLGHRRKLLREIADLRAAGVIAAAPAAVSRTAETAERRHVTVMFSDLVGSTALAAGRDPEDLRELISAYEACVAEVVRRFGGFVAQYLGDGVLVYFGYPEAHEDDAENAVRAGLEVVAAVGALKTPTPLQTRVGIASGLVVVGDLVGTGAAQKRDIVGETPNLAARLQAVAEPNTVVLAETTRNLLANLFELEDLGARQVRGLAAPVRIWMALRASTVESRFEALHPSGLTALVGREEETELLLRRWSLAKSGEGRVALISGEAGIGKSRLTAAILDAIAPEPHARLRFFCSPQHTDSAFYPIIGQTERAAGMLHDDTPTQKLDKLDALLARTSTPIESTALFAELLSLPNDGRYPTLELTPQQRRQKTLEALTAQLEALSRQDPVLMIFEDAHWADPTTLEAFGRAVDRIATLRVMLLVTFRPQFEAPWIGRPYVTSLVLNRLTVHESRAMIDRIVGNRFLSAAIRQEIIDRTDGIPLFLEEMTKAVLEAGSQTAAARTISVVPSPSRVVPASLHATLMARLDLLGGPAKEVAQFAAAIGREFSHALLSAATRKPQAKLDAALERLIASGLVFRQGLPPHAIYLFKHALVQDAAYGTLLREQRRALHARIARTLEDEFPDIAESQPELLARHWTEAGTIEKSAGLWGKAGQRSLARSALAEAAEQLSRALDQIATLPATPAVRGEQIKLQVALVNALMHVKGYAAPEPKAAVEQARQFIERAEALGETLEDPLLLFSVLYGAWAASYVAFHGDVTRELAEQFVTLAEKQRQTVPLMIGERLIGTSLMLSGHIAESRAHYDAALALYDPAQHRPLVTRFAQDVGVTIFVYRALAQWMLGYPETALADAERALAHAHEASHAGTLMYAYLHASFTNILCAEFAAASAQSNQLLRLAEEKGAALWKALGRMQKGCTLALSGRPAEAIEMITSGIATYRSTGSRVYVPFFLAHLARAHAELGEFDDAWRCIGEAMNAAETTKERWCEAEILRLTGEIALKLPQLGASHAEAYFELALALARDQEAKSWELRAATSMAQLWRDQGMHAKAHALLAPIHDWFTEGSRQHDLRQAKALLVETSSHQGNGTPA
jgi:predicted ATPase/class 3 adenylate cyclase